MNEEYKTIWKKAQDMADYIDGGEQAGPYSDRINKLPGLISLVEKMRTIENNNDPNFKRKRFNDVKKFLSFFPGLKTFQTFDDSKRKDEGLARIKHCNENKYNGTLKYLNTLNERRAGVFLCINETNGNGRTAKDIIKIRAVFADLDGEPMYPLWGYDPSLVVESSPGKFHVYWCVDDEMFMLEGFTQVQESIAAKFNSDPKVKDLPRVMRVPGFYHKKHEPYMTRIIYTSEKKYDFNTLSEMFPPVPRKQWSAPKYKQTDFKIEGKFKGQYGASEGERNNHLFKRACGMLHRRLSWQEIESEIYKEAAACCPPVSPGEAEAVLKSVRRYS
jgi:hypothetical protein